MCPVSNCVYGEISGFRGWISGFPWISDLATTLILDNKIVQLILNTLPKSYQTFLGIQRGQAHPPTLEALFVAMEVEEQTQESAGHNQDVIV